MKMFKMLSVMLFVVFLCSPAWGIPLMGESFTEFGGFSIVDMSIGGIYDQVIDTTFSGEYLGTASMNNDSKDVLEFLIGTYLDNSSYEMEWYVNVEIEGTSPSSKTSGILTVTWTNDYHSGTWSVAPSVLSFYSVKGANSFAVYELNPAVENGIWSTEHLFLPNSTNKPGLSHMSAATTAPVPEPTTVLLSGLGLLAMGGYLRRRKNKKEII